MFGDRFNQSLDNTTLPSGLKVLEFGNDFNQSLDNTTLPRNMWTLDFGDGFDDFVLGCVTDR